MRQLEHAIAEIEAQMARLENLASGGDHPEMMDELQSKRDQVVGQRSMISTGSLLQLSGLSFSLPATLATIVTSSIQLATRAGMDITHQTLEMTNDELAEHFTATRGLHDQEQVDFRTYEHSIISEIEHLAARNGADLSAFRDRQAEIERLRGQAKANDDRLELYRLDVMSAQNVVDGLTEVGADEAKLAKAEAKLAETRERYLKEREMAAIEQARAQGLSGDALMDFVAADQQAAATEIDNTIVAASRSGETKQSVVVNASLNAALRIGDDKFTFQSQAELAAQPEKVLAERLSDMPSLDLEIDPEAPSSGLPPVTAMSTPGEARPR